MYIRYIKAIDDFEKVKLKLKDIANLQPGVYLKPTSKKAPEKAYLLRLKDFDEELKPIKRGSPVDMAAVKSKYIIEKRDLLFSVRLRFKAIKIEYEEDKVYVASNNFVILRVNEDRVKALYLQWYLNHPQQQEQFEHLSQAMARIPYINTKKLGEFIIDVPDLERQKEILEVNDCLSRQKEIMNKLIEKKEIYTQNLLIKISEK